MENCFNHKYLKYKKKYIDLKNNVHSGAAAADDAVIFTLYTTGLANWLNASHGNTTNQNIASYYQDNKQNIYKQIKKQFPNSVIIIQHYDPLSSLSPEIEEESKRAISKKYIEEISSNDIDNHIIQSRFIQEEFNPGNVDVTMPHIILDFANIFTFTADINRHIIAIDENNWTEYTNLNILRFGFLGDPIAQVIFNSSNLFELEGEKIITLSKLVQIKVADNFIGKYDQVYTFFSNVIVGQPNRLKLTSGTSVNTIKMCLENKFIVDQRTRGITINVFEAEKKISIYNINLLTYISNSLIKIIKKETIDDTNIEKIIVDICDNVYKRFILEPDV